MGGPSTRASEAIATRQADIGQQQYDDSRARQGQMDKYLQPAIDLNTSLISGDPSKALSAAAPILAPLYKSFPAAKDNIYNSVAPGAGRDFALANLERDKASSISGVLSNLTAGAFDKLANIGSGLGSFSLQEVGAALRGEEGAASTQNNVMQGQAASKASQMGLLSSLAGAAGNAAGGIFKSDRRLKKNFQRLEIAVIPDGLARVLPYRFDYINGEKDQIGVMAQDLMEVLPDAVIRDTTTGYYAVDYVRLAVTALAALRQMTEKLRNLQDTVEFAEVNHVTVGE